MLHKALYSFLCVRVWFFCPPASSAQLKGSIEIWGCRGDNNTAGVWFHRPSTVRYIYEAHRLIEVYLFMIIYVFIISIIYVFMYLLYYFYHYHCRHMYYIYIYVLPLWSWPEVADASRRYKAGEPSSFVLHRDDKNRNEIDLRSWNCRFDNRCTVNIIYIYIYYIYIHILYQYNIYIWYIYIMDIHTNLHMNICLSLSEYCTLRVKVMCFEGQGDKLYLHMLHSCLVVSKFKHLFFSWASWSQPTSTFWGMQGNPPY